MDLAAQRTELLAYANYRFRTLSPGGNGWRYSYFNSATSNDELIQVAHSLALIHMHPTGPAHPLPATPFTIMLGVFRALGWLKMFPFREKLGLFLMFRACSQQSCTFASTWYADEARVFVVGTTRIQRLLRQERERRIDFLLRYECFCHGFSIPGLACDPEWFRFGWICPFAIPHYIETWGSGPARRQLME